MKKTKFISCLLSAVLILSAITVPVAAADVNQDSSGGKATVSYTNDSVWTATIPAYVAPVEAGQQDVSAYEVAVKDVVIGDNQQLAATVEYSGYVTEANGVKIPYQLYDSNGEEIQSGDTILSKSAGEPNTEAAITFGAALTDSPKYAGVYTDTATFAFTAKDKVYTLDEINNDEHLFAIGKTKPEYVVAQFDEDFSEVRIFKNGEDSDGWMKSFQDIVFGGDTPTDEHRDTLEKAVVEEGVLNIGLGMFRACNQMTDVIFPESLVIIEESAFWDCKSLKSLELPKQLSTIENSAFGYCESLEGRVVIPDNVKIIEPQTFRSCSSLSEVVIPNGVTSIGKFAFAGCDSLKEIIIPDSVNEIAEFAFNGCGALTSVTLPIGISCIEQGVFQSCLSLTDIVMPNTVTIIGNQAFMGCESLTDVIIPDGVTEIGSYAFSQCYLLETITIPASVTYIGDNVFWNGFMHPTSIKFIYGSTGSYAETWATENGYTFIAQ